MNIRYIIIVVLILILIFRATKKCPEQSCPEQTCPEQSCPEQNCPELDCPSCPEQVCDECVDLTTCPSTEPSGCPQRWCKTCWVPIKDYDNEFWETNRQNISTMEWDRSAAPMDRPFVDWYNLLEPDCRDYCVNTPECGGYSYGTFHYYNSNGVSVPGHSCKLITPPVVLDYKRGLDSRTRIWKIKKNQSDIDTSNILGNFKHDGVQYMGRIDRSPSDNTFRPGDGELLAEVTYSGSNLDDLILICVKNAQSLSADYLTLYLRKVPDSVSSSYRIIYRAWKGVISPDSRYRTTLRKYSPWDRYAMYKLT